MSTAEEKIFVKPVQLAQYADVCIAFREDSFVLSFGNPNKFYEEDGKGAERYIEWLRVKIAKDPDSVVHIWRGDQIIGQIEMGRLRDEQSCGYVNLYYLISSMRGQGIGPFLDHHAMEYFKKQGLTIVRLSVSPTNTRAISFYKKMGWLDLGPRPGHPEVHFMEKQI